MRQMIAIVFLSFATFVGANATDNDDVQQGIFVTYLKMANEGDMVAQYVVAQRYETGRGTTKDMDKAYYWYEKAAKQNYPLAVVKIEDRQKQQAKTEPVAAEKSPVAVAEPVMAEKRVEKPAAKKSPAQHKEVVAKSKPKPAKAASAAVPTPPPVHATRAEPPQPVTHAEAIKQEVRPALPVIVAKAPVVEEPAVPNLNVMQTLLAGKWKRNQQDADFLPSSNAACLQSSGAEMVCFSQELTRNVDRAGMTYNVKSVISGINNREARFNLRYIYNVVHVADKPFSQTNGMPNEVNDMAVKTGWQEPGVSLDCHLRDEHSLTCTRADRKMSYQFVRE